MLEVSRQYFLSVLIIVLSGLSVMVDIVHGLHFRVRIVQWRLCRLRLQIEGHLHTAGMAGGDLRCYFWTGLLTRMGED